MDFNKLNSELHQLSMPHRFPRKATELDEGYLKISDWLADLCFHFEERRKNQESSDESEFQGIIKEYREKIEELEPSEYREGLLKAISEVFGNA